MASPVKVYQREMHDNLNFFATWLPGDPIEVGDVGLIEGGRFRHIASLTDLGLPCDVDVGQGRQDVQYISRAGTTVTTSAGVAAAAIAKAEITVEFSTAGAFVFHASGLQALRLRDRAVVDDEIVKAYQRKAWRKEWLLVEALYRAERATIIVSQDGSAQLVLAASLAGPIPTVSLADPKLHLSVASTRGRIVHVVASQGLHPLYSCLRLADPLFGKASLQAVREHRHEDDAPLSRPSIDELLDA